MSHVVAVNLIITDVDAYGRAAAKMGGELVKGQQTHKWYGVFLDDWNSDRAAGRRRDPATFGKCDHVIRLKNGGAGAYEIGLVARPDGGFDAVYDAFAGGYGLEIAFGKDLARLNDEYAAVLAEEYWQGQGYTTERQTNVQGETQIVSYQR